MAELRKSVAFVAKPIHFRFLSFWLAFAYTLAPLQHEFISQSVTLGHFPFSLSLFLSPDLISYIVSSAYHTLVCGTFTVEEEIRIEQE